MIGVPGANYNFAKEINHHRDFSQQSIARNPHILYGKSKMLVLVPNLRWRYLRDVWISFASVVSALACLRNRRMALIPCSQ